MTDPSPAQTPAPYGYPAHPYAAPVQPTGQPWPAPWAPHPGPDAGRIPTGGPAPWHRSLGGAGPLGGRGPRWRRTLLVGAAVLAVLVVVAIVLLSGSSSGPTEARQVAQAYVEARAEENWEPEWDMLCAVQQLTWGSAEYFARRHAAVYTDFTFVYGGARPVASEARYVEEASAYLVEVSVAAHGAEDHYEVIVAEERGSLCIGGLR